MLGRLWAVPAALPGRQTCLHAVGLLRPRLGRARSFPSVSAALLLLCCAMRAASLAEGERGAEREAMRGPPAAQPSRPIVVIETSKGAMTAELWPEKAPNTVSNFLAYADTNFYSGLIFHRVVKGFVIQGGGYAFDLRPQPTRPPIRNEASSGTRNLRGALAMSRGMAVDGATSQFFINLADNPFLDHGDESARRFGYCVFGKVVKGMEVADEIGSVETGEHGAFRDVPLEPVRILAIRRAQAEGKPVAP